MNPIRPTTGDVQYTKNCNKNVTSNYGIGTYHKVPLIQHHLDPLKQESHTHKPLKDVTNNLTQPQCHHLHKLSRNRQTKLRSLGD